ncbi:MAG: hypothetical protein J1E64_00215 [Acetatifactor sp.]|nr:hypothetical protein [Acetatifactor sp.]
MKNMGHIILKIRNSIGSGKKIITDFGYNILATIAVTAALQLVVYPYLAVCFSGEIYGQLLTIMGVANVFISSLGGSLNNVRLLQKDSYNERNVTGDFSLLLIGFSAIGTLIFGMIISIQFRVLGWPLFILLLMVCIGIIEGYWTVAYRIVINYKAYLIYNVLMSIGYLVGIFIAKQINIWSIPFILGEFFALLFLIKSTLIYKEPFKITPLFPKTLKIYVILIGTNLIVNAVNYLDRFFLYPILGGEQVSIYTVSSFVGKSIGLLVTPIAGVLLSYYAQSTFKMTVKRYWTINGITLVVGGVAGILAVILSPWVTGILYPTLIEDARQYLWLANIASLIGALANILAPSVLKFANIFWQIIIQLAYVVIYLGMGYLLLLNYGLLGFCVATLAVNLIRMLFLMLIGHISIRNSVFKQYV